MKVNKRVPLSATVDQTLIDWIDERVATGKFRSRSHGVEYLLRLAIENEKSS